MEVPDRMKDGAVSVERSPVKVAIDLRKLRGVRDEVQ